MTDAKEVVERLAKAIYANDLAWDHMLEKNKERFRRDARRCLDELSAMGRVVVPNDPTKAMWGGLARDIMMWLDIYDGGKKTPRNLFKHLENVGREIPQWLRDEPEMKALDHVPSKGTRAAIIYRAMLTASPKVQP